MKQVIILIIVSIVTSMTALAYGSTNIVTLPVTDVVVSDSGDAILLSGSLPTPCAKNARAQFALSKDQTTLDLLVVADKFNGLCATVVGGEYEVIVNEQDVQAAVENMKLNPNACYEIREPRSRFHTEICLGSARTEAHEQTLGGLIMRSSNGKVDVVLPKSEFSELKTPYLN